jgi:hypothetical protein
MPGYLSVWRSASAHASKKTDLLALVDSYRDRIHWLPGKAVLERYGVPTANGWLNTIEEINLRDRLDEVDLDGLYSAYVAHTCCGEKSVRFYDLGRTNALNLREYLESEDALNRLPQPLSRSSLRKAKVGPPALVHVMRQGLGYYAVYATIRSREERIRISSDALPKDTAIFQGYDELIAVRSVKYGAYGAIWVPDNGNTVEVRVDYRQGDTVHDLNSFHQLMYAALHTASGSASVIQPTYLHEAIKSLYDAKGDGVVTDLSFSTTTGSVKNERMRSAQCLRDETFHVGGRAALKTEIEPYKIGLNWALRVDGTKEFTYPQLFLDGNINDGNALLSATIRKANTYKEYDWVRDKLIEHL